MMKIICDNKGCSILKKLTVFVMALICMITSVFLFQPGISNAQTNKTLDDYDSITDSIILSQVTVSI